MKARGAGASLRPAPRLGRFERVYAAARKIPRGRVATYGQLAAMAGFPRNARLAGFAMAGVGDASRVPWHRVVNAQGRISPRGCEPSMALQRQRLEAEGVRFGRSGAIDLERFQWRPEEIRTGRIARLRPF